MPILANVIYFISITSSISKSHIHIIIILANLNAGYDNFGLNKLFIIKKVITLPYWKDFKRVMYIKF